MPNLDDVERMMDGITDNEYESKPRRHHVDTRLINGIYTVGNGLCMNYPHCPTCGPKMVELDLQWSFWRWCRDLVWIDDPLIPVARVRKMKST